MKKSKFRKLLSVLCLTLILTTVFVPSFADETGGSSGTGINSNETVKEIVRFIMPIVGLIVFVVSILFIKDRKFRELGGLILVAAVVFTLGFMATNDGGWFGESGKLPNTVKELIK